MTLLLRNELIFIVILVSFCLFPRLASSCDATPAQPGKAVFYPNEVQVSVSQEQEAMTLPSGRKGMVVVLPSGAMRDSFMLSLGGTPAAGYYWPEKEEKEAILALCSKDSVPSFAQLPENEASTERRELLEKLLPLSAEKALREGELRSAQTRLDLLRKSFDQYGGNQGKDVSPADEAAKLVRLYSEEYPKIQREVELAQRALADAGVQLEKAEKALRDFDSLHGGDLVVVPYETAGVQKLEYAYLLPASCEISYRLDARPGQGEFSVNQDVALGQYSGFTWKDVDLYVSTVRRDTTLRPVNIRPWEIRLVDKNPPAQNRYMMEEAVQMASPMADAKVMAAGSPRQAEPPRAPVLQERGTYRLWSLGRRSLAFGAPVNLSLATDTYPAAFRYTLRPVSSPKGFLTADIALDKPLELPPGMAQFSVDGAVMGRQVFSFNGDKGTIFFGSDPQVTAIMRDLKQTSGEKGFFSKEQTRSWHWRITVTSTRPQPVEAVLEDPAPVSKDEAITLVTQSNPRPEEIVNDPRYGGARIYQWKLNLKPGEPVVVDHRIQMVAPVLQDKEVSPGR